MGNMRDAIRFKHEKITDGNINTRSFDQDGILEPKE